MELSDGTWIYDAGKTEESPETKGMAFLVRKNFKDYIEGFCKHSDRVISCKVKLQEGSLQIIQVYAPTTDYDDEEAEKFYEDLENAIEKKCANTVIMGDFNAKIGVKDEDEENEWIGPFGIGTRNERGEKLIDFCTANRLFVTNSFFKKPRSRYWTWESPGGDYKNQTDFILTTDKTTIQNTEIITKVDIGSDHRMVRSRMTINKKLTRLKRIKKKKPLKINTRQLEKVAPSFQIKLKNKFDILRNEKPSIEVMNETIRKCAAEVVEKPNETTKEQNAEDKLIEELEQRRKELRRKDNKTGPERVEYIETNKTVKKKRRARARRKRKEFITKILEQKRGPKETNKYGNKKKIAKMKDKEGRETSDREEILEICKSFYATLYENTIQSPTNLQRESADKDEVPPFTVDEVRKCLKEMSKNKAPGPDDITSDVLLLGEEPVLKYLTSCYNKILKTKEIPPSWDEAKIIILYKKGDPGDVKNYRPISLLSHSYKLFTRLLQKRMENTLDENQPRDQAGFRRGFSTTDHIFTLNQVIEKSNEYNLPLCVGFIDYEKAFDSVEHFAIFDALRKININETYVAILENIYQKATARVHIDNLESETFPINRGVRQGDPISPKMFTTAMEMIFRKAGLEHGINVDGETLTNLRFADDVALVTEKIEDMEEQLNKLNTLSLETGLRMHKGKTKYMTNFESNENIHIENEEIEKVNSYKYLGQTTHLKETTKEEVTCRIRAGWSCFGRNKEIFQDEKMPLSLKRQVYNQCILPTMTYGCQTWSLTKALTQKLRVAQRAMERKMLRIKLKDKVPCKEIRRRTQVKDIVDFITKQKWKWAGHAARYQDNRWTLRVTEWQPRHGKRSRGRQVRRWRDDIVKIKGATWSRDAKDRDGWKADAEGYFLQWRDTAL
ncbi:hypothetical protein RRG08_027978 [Elysia crispata]|uniref:Reverse transcriptase domain-containing protein n=1 Tax=Elysia crispata TaxID=231223 RepID=A0AAE1ED16_9GAST|nr:hypothetical protein RRG08_027978 [Elysia crispata]